MKQGDAGWNSGWLNMGLSSGLTLQMDLIVLRNSIFCHSAGTQCPSLGPDCSKRGPYQRHSGCGIEELSSASNQTMRKNDREEWEKRRRGKKKREKKMWERGGGVILQMLLLSHLDTNHTHTLTYRMCTCSSTHTSIYCMYNTCVQFYHTWIHMSTNTLCKICQ